MESVINICISIPYNVFLGNRLYIFLGWHPMVLRVLVTQKTTGFILFTVIIFAMSFLPSDRFNKVVNQITHDKDSKNNQRFKQLTN